MKANKLKNPKEQQRNILFKRSDKCGEKVDFIINIKHE